MQIQVTKLSLKYIQKPLYDYCNNRLENTSNIFSFQMSKLWNLNDFSVHTYFDVFINGCKDILVSVAVCKNKQKCSCKMAIL